MDAQSTHRAPSCAPVTNARLQPLVPLVRLREEEGDESIREPADTPETQHLTIGQIEEPTRYLPDGSVIVDELVMTDCMIVIPLVAFAIASFVVQAKKGHDTATRLWFIANGTLHVIAAFVFMGFSPCAGPLGQWTHLIWHQLYHSRTGVAVGKMSYVIWWIISVIWALTFVPRWSQRGGILIMSIVQVLWISVVHCRLNYGHDFGIIAWREYRAQQDRDSVRRFNVAVHAAMPY